MIMDSRNYVQMMISSLEKKISLLDELQKETDVQTEIIRSGEIEKTEFEESMVKKEKAIEMLIFLDNGFQNIYDKMSDTFKENKDVYASEIKKMQELIKCITEKSTHLQTSEHRNDMMMKTAVKTARDKIHQSRVSAAAVNGYYKSMAAGKDTSFYMDSKK